MREAYSAFGVFLDETARRGMDAAAEKWPRADDVWIVVEYVLAHDPEVSTALNESGRLRAFTWDGAASAQLPTVDVIYAIGSTDITIKSMRWRNAQNARAGRA